jgi:hypothetical protein
MGLNKVKEFISMIMALLIMMAHGKTTKSMALAHTTANKSSMKVVGNITPERAVDIMLTSLPMKLMWVLLTIVIRMAVVDLFLETVVFIQVIFMVIYPMVREILNMLIKINSLASSRKEKNREEELTILAKALSLMGFGRMMKKLKAL